MSTPNPTEENKFGRYSVVEPLAKGGMAQIFKARTTQGKTFTLKKILKDYSDNTDFIQMFLQEAKISLQLKHPNCVRVLDFGQIDGTYFLAMEYVFGRDVSALLKKCAENRMYIPMDVVCHIIHQCALGLDYAHNLKDSFGNALSIVHRDISPPNILISYNGEVKVLDFGIAKAVSSAGREATRSGVLKGKFSYMSPEQASGKPLDQQSDVFSLGTVFYELLTTRNLFYMPDEIETLERVRKADVNNPAKVRKDIPADLDKIVMKSLALKTKNRFQNCGEMADAIQGFLQKYYPRSDLRSVAKFLRGVFSQDFQNRYKVSIREGWRDILEVGGADDELLLDQSDSRPIYRTGNSQRTGGELKWTDRILYDPKTKLEIKRMTVKALILIATISGSIFLYLTYKADGFKSWFQSKTFTETTAPQATALPLQNQEFAVGTYAYWMDKGQKSLNERSYETALRSYERAIEINPYDINAQIQKNFSLLGLGRFDEACPWLLSQKEIPGNDKMLSTAVCEEAQGENQKALLSYTEFLNHYGEDKRVDQIRAVITSLRRKLSR